MKTSALLKGIRGRLRNPFRTMYGSGREASANPSMAASARAAPEAVPHAQLGPDDGDRSFGGAGVFGEEKPQERRSTSP